MSNTLNNNDTLFRLVADATEVCIWKLGEDGKSIFYNKYLLAFLGNHSIKGVTDWNFIIHRDDAEYTLTTIRTAIAARQPFSLVCRLLRFDGQWRWMEAKGNPLVDHEQKFVGFVGSAIDVTEFRNSKDTIKETKIDLAFAIDGAELGVFDYNPINHKFRANERMRGWFGLGQDEEFDLMSGISYIETTDQKRVEDAVKKVLTWGGGDYDIKYTIVHPVTGQKRIVHAKGKASFGEDKLAYRFNGILQDVTAETIALQKMEESEQRFQNLIRDASTAIVVHTGPEMKVELVNAAYAKIINLTPDDLLGKPIFSVIPEAEDHFRPQLERVMRTGETIQEFDTPYSNTVNGILAEGYVNVTYQPYRNELNEILGVMVIAQDVTESVAARKKLEQSEKKFEAAIAAVEGIIWTNNANGEMAGEQPGWAALTGQAYEEYQGYGWTNAVHPEDAAPTTKAWNDAVADKKIFEFEHRLKTKSKGWRTFAVKAVPSFDTDGNIEEWVGVHTDITEQKAGLQKILESEERFKALADDSPIFIFIIEPEEDARISYWNETWLTYTGQNAQQALGTAWNGILHPDDVKITYDIFVPSFSKNQAYEIPAARVKRFDGEYRWHSFKGNPRFTPNGDFDGYIGVGWDIHEQKINEIKIKESEERFKALADESPIFIFIIEADIEVPVSYWNKTWCTYTGQTAEQALGTAWTGILHPDDVPGVYDIYIPAFEKREPYEIPAFRIKRFDGVYRWHSCKASPRFTSNGDFDGYIGVGWDIHEQKVNEIKIKESEERIRTLVYSSPSAIAFLQGEDLVINIANDAMKQFWGKGNDVVGKKYFEVLPELAEQGLVEIMQDIYNTGIPFNAVEKPLYLIENGKSVLRYYNFILFPQKDIDNGVNGVGIIATEVTDQAIINNKLKESEQQFSTLANNIQNLAWMADETGSIYWYNQRWFEYTGTTLEEMQGWGWQKVHHPDYVNEVVNFVSKAWQKNEPWTLTFPLKGVDGNYRRFLTRATPTNDANGNISRWIGTNTDIEEQKSFAENLEAQVNERTWQLHKANNGLKDKNVELGKINKELESFTYVASHDLQEPLRKIQTYASALLADEKETLSEKGKKYIDRMISSAFKMQSLIKDLLNFSSLSFADAQLETTDIGKIIKEFKEEFEDVITEKKAVIALGESMADVKVIPYQFRQLLYNLLGNALKFVNKDITPHIIINSIRQKGVELRNPNLVPSAVYSHISITDNGIGIPPEHVERIFEVFKRLHHDNEYKGTGIGLSIVKKVVENHHGSITVESELGKGTVFNIYIPD